MERLHVNYKNNQIKILCACVFVVLLFMSVGYSVLKSDLSIKGKIKVVGYKEPILAVNEEDTTVVFNQTMDKSTVESIEFKDSSVVPDDAINSWDASAAKDSSVVAYILDEDNNDLYELYIIGRGGVIANSNSSCAFYGFSNAKTITFNNSYNTKNVTDMYRMFECCSCLTNLDLSSFDTSNVTDMLGMFSNCSSLINLNLSAFDTSNVIYMCEMFWDCTGLQELDLSAFNTASLTDMGGMFCDCSSLTNLNLSNFNTENVTSMEHMFDNCSSLTNLNLSNFNTSKVTTMVSMFNGCKNITSLDLSAFNTASVKKMSYMFRKCSSLENLDIRNFIFNSVTNSRDMFLNARSGLNIFVGGEEAKSFIEGVTLSISANITIV